MSKLKIIIPLAVFLAAAGVIAYFFLHPIVTDHQIREEAKGMDLLQLHEKYPDVIGWIQVEGTNIDYPVMIGEKYLTRSMKDEYSAAGTPFVEDDWTSRDRLTIVYGLNMWMNKTMFNALHKFEEKDFYDQNKQITFYAICGDEVPYVEKRTYETTHCILTDVSQWNYGSAQYIEDDIEMKEFIAECDERSLYGQCGKSMPEEMILLSTCSYHIKGKDGRTVLAGMIKEKTEDSTVY